MQLPCNMLIILLRYIISCVIVYIILTVEGFPDLGMNTSDDDDESGISPTGVSTIVLAILLSVAIVIAVIVIVLYLMKRGSVYWIIVHTLAI